MGGIADVMHAAVQNGRIAPVMGRADTCRNRQAHTTTARSRMDGRRLRTPLAAMLRTPSARRHDRRCTARISETARSWRRHCRATCMHRRKTFGVDQMGNASAAAMAQRNCHACDRGQAGTTRDAITLLRRAVADPWQRADFGRSFACTARPTSRWIASGRWWATASTWRSRMRPYAVASRHTGKNSGLRCRLSHARGSCVDTDRIARGKAYFRRARREVARDMPDVR